MSDYLKSLTSHRSSFMSKQICFDIIEISAIPFSVSLFVDLFKKASDDTARRDYLYYLAVGYTRIKVNLI